MGLADMLFGANQNGGMLMRHIFLMLAIVTTVCGCASVTPIPATAQTEFTYDYQVPNKTKLEIWTSARAYIAQAFVDSKSVIQIEDPNDGTIYGNGTAEWNIFDQRCLTAFQIRFAAKNGKARLQLEIESQVPAGSQCRGWPMPSKTGYR
ncbi:MAG: DUF4468 domain-containing protein, partial [Stenotrophobium sp.]